MVKIYLDDERTPIQGEWEIVRDYNQFVKLINKYSLNNISMISLDHDLGDSAKEEYYDNVEKNNTLDYNHISEKTGYDCAKYLVEKFYLENPSRFDMDPEQKLTGKISFPEINVHSANPIGSQNIISYINNFLRYERQPQSTSKVVIPHTVKD